jgi:hypothetical protein
MVPQEILDLIIDRLHDETATLKACCLVSRAWVQRARKYLFAHIQFHAFTCPVSRWKETFPDPMNSPAHHTRALSIRHPESIPVAHVDTLLTFRNVIRLDVETGPPQDYLASLIPLNGISTVIRSLRLTFTYLNASEVFGLICSLPLLEDLTLVSHALRPLETWIRPRTSPRLTGSLELYMKWGIHPITYRLLDLPNGLHFKKITVSLLSLHDIGQSMNLVSRCSDTLESLSITNLLSGAFHPISVPDRNLSFT